MPRPKKSVDRKPRPIKLPPRLWAALDADARRCLRDSTSHLEALLTKWFKLGDIEIRFEGKETPTKKREGRRRS